MIAEFNWMLWHQAVIIRQNLLTYFSSLHNWGKFWISYNRYKRLARYQIHPKLEYLYPCINDNIAETPIEPIYFYQDTWAFERIVQNNPQVHVDVGSQHIFVALLSKILPVTMVDIRPIPLPLNSLNFQKGSILDLPFEDDSILSLSSLCVIEHIGLGRYGDPLDPLGTEKAIAELKRVLAPGGDLYVSVPLDDDNRVYFNAHRAFKEEYLLELFTPFKVIQKRYICGNRFLEHPASGFTTGCYHLRYNL